MTPNIVLVMLSEHNEIKVPPFALLYLGGALRRAGYQVTVLHRGSDHLDECLQVIRQHQPLLVGFSVLTGPATAYSATLSRKIKESMPVAVIWGGVHPSLLPAQCAAEEYIDAVVIGEGEETLVELADALRDKTPFTPIRGIAYKTANTQVQRNPPRPFIRQLDSFRMDFSLVDMAAYVNERRQITGGTTETIRSLGYVASRGCPYGCGFCYNLKFNQRTWRPFAAATVIEDIQMLKDRYGINEVHFWDDNFFVDRSRALRLIEAIGVIPGIEIRIDALDEELVRQLHAYKVDQLLIGAESGSDRVLRLINKGFNTEKMREKIQLLARYHIKALYSFILGIPTETRDELYQTLDLIVAIHRMHPVASFTVGSYLPYPGTPLYAQAIAGGFQPPETTEEWGRIDRWKNSVVLPWVDRRVILNVRNLTAMLGWRWGVLNWWIRFRLKHRVLLFSYDIKILIRLRMLGEALRARAGVKAMLRFISLRRFGYPTAWHTSKPSLGSRLGLALYGTPFMGSFIRACYFAQYYRRAISTAVLDAGCGSGDYAFYLASRYPQVAIDAVDIEGIEECRLLQQEMRLPNLHFRQEDLRSLNTGPRYNFIYSIDVLEHIVEKELVLKRFFELLEPGGYLYLHLPQKDWGRRYIFNPRWFGHFQEFEAREHRGPQFDLEGFSALVKENGFTIIQARWTFGFLGRLAWELSQLCQERNRGYRKALLLPFLKLLGSVDARCHHRRGSGILVFAQKQA